MNGVRRNGATVKRGFAVLFLLAGCASATPEPAQEPVRPTMPPPTTPVAVAVPEPQPAMKAPPQLSDPKALSLPQVTERTLDNGLRILVVEHHELPIADFVMIVKSGSEEDPNRREGVASLTAAMLDEGTRTRNTFQIADQIGYLGINLTTASGAIRLRFTAALRCF